jgi:TonB family protein
MLTTNVLGALSGLRIDSVDRISGSKQTGRMPWLPLPLGVARAIVLTLVVGGWPTRLPAQDTSVTAVRWTEAKDQPDEIPTLIKKPRVAFPESLRKTPDIEYVILDFILSPKAKSLSANPAATTPALERAYREASDQFRFTPGKRDGKPVNTAVTLAVLFNPASAATDLPNATPRLLEVSLVTVPRPAGAKEKDNFPNQIVFVDVVIDVSGAISALKNAPPELADPLAIAAKNWRFAPARKAGIAVEAEVRVPFITRTPDAISESGERIVPKVIARAHPVYPYGLQASGLRGEVLVDFVVDIEGRVRDAFVMRSLNPAFDDPALAAVGEWRFEPGRIGDCPVNTHMQVPVIFNLRGVPDGGEDGLRTLKKPDMSSLPPELRYDIPPRLTGMERPVYPLKLLREGIEGSASVRLLINEQGQVLDAIVVKASHPEFGQALLAAAEQFHYEPATKGGRPNKALLGFTQEFKRDNMYQLVSRSELALLQREKKKPETITGAAGLDAKLTPTSRRPPNFPLSQIEVAPTGEAVIEFIVDEDGRVRLPHTISASHEAFGYAAIQGVAAWRFQPPKRGGRSVAVRVQIPIQFSSGAKP